MKRSFATTWKVPRLWLHPHLSKGGGGPVAGKRPAHLHRGREVWAAMHIAQRGVERLVAPAVVSCLGSKKKSLTADEGATEDK